MCVGLLMTLLHYVGGRLDWIRSKDTVAYHLCLILQGVNALFYSWFIVFQLFGLFLYQAWF